MAFDRTDPADLAALKTEVTTDPIGMGYNPISDNQVIKPINDPDANVGGETVGRVFTQEAMLEALDPTNLDDQQTNTGAGAYVQALASYQGDISAFKAKFRAMFAANSATVQALDAQTRNLSRAEVLFGEGTVISVQDWWAARDS